MAKDVALRCRCGAVQGTVHGLSAANCNNCVCYCIDCQTFAHHLGVADSLLDAHGGTHIVQVAPGSITIEKGLENVGLKQLSPSGLYRWYATCCGVPLGNTMNKASSPFMGLNRQALDVSDDAFFGRLYPVMGKYAQGDRSRVHAPDKYGAVATLRVLRLLPGWLMRGNAKKSPFFDATTQRPIAAPQVLSKEERAAARPQHAR